MSGPADQETDAISRLRRRLRFRSWHRGTREADLLLGRFADACLDGFGPAELACYAALLEESDPDIFDWVTGRLDIPEAAWSDLVRALKRHSYPQTES